MRHGVVAVMGIVASWGLVYANMAFMTGVIYTREFLYAGICIFGGCLLAAPRSDLVLRHCGRGRTPSP